MGGNEARSEIGRFVRASLGTPQLTDADNLFEAGNASSLFAMELVMFIEEQLGVVLDDSDLERDNFDSIESMTQLVEAKRSGS